MSFLLNGFPAVTTLRHGARPVLGPPSLRLGIAGKMASPLVGFTGLSHHVRLTWSRTVTTGA